MPNAARWSLSVKPNEWFSRHARRKWPVWSQKLVSVNHYTSASLLRMSKVTSSRLAGKNEVYTRCSEVSMQFYFSELDQTPIFCDRILPASCSFGQYHAVWNFTKLSTLMLKRVAVKHRDLRVLLSNLSVNHLLNCVHRKGPH